MGLGLEEGGRFRRGSRLFPPLSLPGSTSFSLFDGHFATCVKGPGLVLTMAIWITTVVLDEGLSKETNTKHYIKLRWVILIIY